MKRIRLRQRKENRAETQRGNQVRQERQTGNVIGETASPVFADGVSDQNAAGSADKRNDDGDDDGSAE